MKNCFFLLLFSIITVHGMADDTSAAVATVGEGAAGNLLGHLPVDIQKVFLISIAPGMASELLSMVHVDATICQGHTGRVGAVAWAPDGKVVAFELMGKAKLDSYKGRIRTTKISNEAHSPDFKLFALRLRDNTIRVQSACLGRLHILTGHTDFLNGFTWSPNGEILASASNDKTVRLWDMRKLRSVREWLESGCPSMRPVVKKDTKDSGGQIIAPPLFLYAVVKKLLAKKESDAPVKLTIQEMGAWACLPREVQEALIGRVAKKEDVPLTWGESLVKESEGLVVEDAYDGSGAAGAFAAAENGKDEEE